MFKEIFYGLNVLADRLSEWLVRIDWDVGPGDWSCEEETTVERIYDKRRLLKIKLKSLMEEVKIIRAEEGKLQRAAKRGSAGARAMIEEMAVHRRKDLRKESRATLLAYNYIRGRAYAQTEPNAGYEPTFYVQKRIERILKMVFKYGPPVPPLVAEAAIRAWMGVDPSGARIVV